MSERCENTELPVEQCAHCRMPKRRIPARVTIPETGERVSLFDGPSGEVAPVNPAPERRPTMLAQYDGWCPACDERICGGLDAIVLDEGEWVHEQCV